MDGAVANALKLDKRLHAFTNKISVDIDNHSIAN